MVHGRALPSSPLQSAGSEPRSPCAAANLSGSLQRWGPVLAAVLCPRHGGESAPSGINWSLAVIFQRNWTGSSTAQKVRVAIRKQKPRGTSCSSHWRERFAVLLCLLLRISWDIRIILLRGFTIRELVQLKTNLYFQLDGVPDRSRTKTPVSTLGACGTPLLSDGSLHRNRSLLLLLEPANLQYFAFPSRGAKVCLLPASAT